MNEEKRNKLVEAFADFTFDYADRIVKDSCEVSIKTNIYDGYFTSNVYFSLEFVKPIKDDDIPYDKDASEFAKVLSDMCRKFQKVVLNNK